MVRRMTASVEVLTVDDVAERAQVGRGTVYRAVRLGRLRAARVNERGDLRFTAEWVGAWLEGCALGSGVSEDVGGVAA